MAALSGNQFKAVLYILLNVASGTGIVFANKIVLSVYKFHFVYALTLIHTTATMVGTHLSLSCVGYRTFAAIMCAWVQTGGKI